MKKERDSNLELLRIIAMLMIVFFHLNCRVVEQLTNSDSMERMGNALFILPFFYKRLLIVHYGRPLGAVGNAIFMLISGYFMANKGRNVDIGKISKKLLLQLGFASGFAMIISMLLFRWNSDYYSGLQNIGIYNAKVWYVGFYFMIILSARLFYNNFLEKMDQKEYTTFLLALFAFFSFSWSGKMVENLAVGGRTFLSGMFLYALGGYIRRFDVFDRIRTYVMFLGILVTYVFITISVYNNTQLHIGVYHAEGGNGYFLQSFEEFSNYQIPVIVLGVCIFEIFRRIKIPNSRIINYFGASTFMVYLLHDLSILYTLADRQDWVMMLYDTPILFFVKLIAWSLATFACASLVYGGYNILMSLFHKNKKLFVK